MVRSRGALDGGAGAVEFKAVMDHIDEDLQRNFPIQQNLDDNLNFPRCTLRHSAKPQFCCLTTWWMEIAELPS